MFEALRAVVRLGLDHVNAKTRAGERLAERFLVRRRPKSDATARLQSVCDTIESAATVDLRVPRLHKRSGSVIDIEKNGVIPRLLRAPDDSKNILGENFYPAVVQQSAVYLHQELPIPLDHLRQQFRNVNLRLFPTIESTAFNENPSPNPPIRTRGCGCRLKFSHASFASRISDVVEVVLMSWRPLSFMK